MLDAANPICGAHWMKCIENNPGGDVPLLNPTEWDELLIDLFRYETRQE